jgi:4-carboxymuconolactone decarboxylase
MNRDEQFEQGLRMRQQVMGEAFVDKVFATVDAFAAPLQEFVTRNAWGSTWCHDGLDLNWMNPQKRLTSPLLINIISRP